MPNTRKPYPPEFREQMVALVRAGRTPDDLAHEFEPTAQSISNWVAQADRDTGRRTDGLTTTARAEFRRENHQLKLEREILSTGTPEKLAPYTTSPVLASTSSKPSDVARLRRPRRMRVRWRVSYSAADV